MVSQELEVITANHPTSSLLCTSATHLLPQRSVQTTGFIHYCCFQLHTWGAGDAEISPQYLKFLFGCLIGHMNRSCRTPAIYHVYHNMKLDQMIQFAMTKLVMYPQRTYITRDIVATDGGNRSTSVELAVSITNVKNQPPQWEQENYSTVIPENTARDTPIVVRVLI